MKALGVAELPPGPWLTEIKFDGYRALALVAAGRASLWSRNRHEIGGRYPELVAALQRLPCRTAVLDGEIVALDALGRSRFQLLQRRGEGGAPAPLAYYLFDLLQLDGRSLLDCPIEERKAELERLVPPGGRDGVLRLSSVLRAAPAAVLAEARKRGLEGVVLKRPGSRYEPGRRSGAWIKRRISRDQEFVIGGFTAPAGSRAHFGAILVGYHDREGALRYAGKVGTGFDRRSLSALHRRFRPLARKRSPFAGGAPAAGGGVTWLAPRLVAQIRFSEWTGDSHLRQPVYLGLREDKRAAEVVRES